MKMELDKICDILGVKNPFENKTITNVTHKPQILKEDGLYFTVISEGFDGYDFDVNKMKQLRATIVTTKQIADLPCIIVENPALSLYDVGEAVRAGFEGLKTAVVTGSVGKTSAKEMVKSVLSAAAETVANVGSVNSTREACRLVFEMKNTCKYMVMELGLRSPNMPFMYASKVLKPNAGLITNIGHSHIENFKNMEHILEHKLSITAGMDKNSTLFLNGDDSLLFNHKYDFKTVFFAINNQAADFLAKDIVEDEKGSSFKIVSKDGKVNFEARLNAPGRHNILNALGAAAIALSFGIDEQTIAKGINSFKTKGFRNNTVQGYKNNTLIVDCYNATPESMISGFEVLKSAKVKEGKKKIAILGHMMRLGILSEELHRKTGRDAASYNFDTYITYGLDAHYIYEELKSAGKKAYEFFTKSDICEFLRNNIEEGDAVLFKGVEKFHNFQDLYYYLVDDNFKADDSKQYRGIISNNAKCHSEAKSIYFADDDNIYTAKYENEKVQVKDITFLFLLLLAAEQNRFDEKVTISGTASKKYIKSSTVRFNETKQFILKDLWYAILFCSSFEAAQALIEHCFGNFKEFKAQLIKKFDEIGVKNTSIVSFSHETNKDNYTTAYDMWLIGNYIAKNQKILDLFNEKNWVLNNLVSGKRTPIETENKLLLPEKKVTEISYYAGFARGLKSEKLYETGNVVNNKSIISLAMKNSKPVIGVILGSDEFHYCRNSYMDMKRILKECLNA